MVQIPGGEPNLLFSNPAETLSTFTRGLTLAHDLNGNRMSATAAYHAESDVADFAPAPFRQGLIDRTTS